jgi:molybdopterin-guanine dinucleotide biosynthesis protein A
MLLAGGSSRRMRVDKATLMIAGEPLWQRQLRVLSGLRPETLWVSGQSGLRWCPIGTEIVTDKMPSRGPLSGVAEGLCLLKTSHLLVLAIDLPQMTTNHLRKLFGLAKPGKGVIPLAVALNLSVRFIRLRLPPLRAPLSTPAMCLFKVLRSYCCNKPEPAFMR